VKIDAAPKNLHGYWDDLLGNGSTKNYAAALAAAQTLAPADATAAADLNEADWVQEGFKLAQTNVYVDPPIGAGFGPFPMATAPNYNANAVKLAQQRVALAGARLAGVINAELK
jgi:hypothetical protein